MTHLALDFDDPRASNKGGNLSGMEPALAYLRKRYGTEHVFLRRSSSGGGWHVWVDVDIPPDEEMRLRKRLGDCPGRRISDRCRLRTGLTTSRLFGIKGTTVMDDAWADGKTKTKKAKQWRN